jgi:uncharacterized lipoprotein YmbA
MLFFAACTNKKASYILKPLNTQHIASTHMQIGVKKVTIPDYLNNDKILIKQNNKIEELDANLAGYPSDIFTHETIVSLKRKLNDPNVFLYPWDIKEKKGVIVDIVIDDYLYSDGYVHLSGTYYIKDKNNNMIYSKNFKLKEFSKKEPQEIIDSLNRLFDSLLNNIARNIAK